MTTTDQRVTGPAPAAAPDRGTEPGPLMGARTESRSAAAEYRAVTALQLGWWSRGPWRPTPGPVTGRGTWASLDRFGPVRRPRRLALPSMWRLPTAAAVLRSTTRSS
jgi:hypothetical protein